MFVYLSGSYHSKQPKFPYNSQIRSSTDVCFSLHFPAFGKDNTTYSKVKKLKFSKENFNVIAICLTGLTVYQLSENTVFNSITKEPKIAFFFTFLSYRFL